MVLKSYGRGVSATLSLAAMVFGAGAALADDTRTFGWQTTIEPAELRSATPVKAPDTPEELYSDAQMYLSLREWAAADRLLRAVVERHPNSASADYARRDIAKLRSEVFGMASRTTLGGPVAPPSPTSSQQAANAPSAVAPWLFPSQQASLQDQFRGANGDRLFFAAFSAALGTRNLETLTAQATWLSARPETKIILEAHSDEPDSSVDAAAIAQARADAVKAALVARGIGPDRIQVVVFGRGNRVALCEAPACRAQNRRVVVRVSDAATGAPPVP